MGLALRVRRAGGALKPPQAASVKSRGGERCGKGPLSAGQVCDEKTNVCEPLLTHRKNRTMASKPGSSGIPGMKARPWGRALGQEAACVLSWRCPVDRWREFGVGAGAEQENLSSGDRLGEGELGQPPDRRAGGPQAVATVRGRVPIRGTGADRLVVAVRAL